MPEDHGSHTEKKAASEPPAPRKDNPVAGERNPGSDGQQDNPRPHWADRIIAIFTGLIFLTYIASNYFACRQMKLTKAAIDQSATNNSAAILAQQTIAQQALTASQQNFQNSLDASREQLRLDQRAWIGEINATLKPLEVGKPVCGEVQYVNSGKTIAKHVYPSLHMHFSREILNNVPPIREDTAKDISIGIIVPGSAGSSSGSDVCTIGFVTEKERQQTKDWYVYIWGEIKYIDIFGKAHQTTFCSYRKLDSTDRFIQCSFHNDAT